MKLRYIVIICITIFLAGCSAQNQITGSQAMEIYASQSAETASVDSFSVKTNAVYSFQYQNEELAAYTINGEMDAQDIEKKPTAYLEQNINSDGSQSLIQSYYYEGTLYNTYNGMQYKEEMSLSDVENILLIPMNAILFSSDQIEEIQMQTKNGMNCYRIHLKDDVAKEMFIERYDCNHLSDNYDVSINEHSIEQRYDENGNFVYESVHYEMGVIYQEKPIDIIYDSSFEKTNINQTAVDIDEETKNGFSQYIDYSEIASDEELVYDEGDTAEEILKSRLKSQLNYQELPSGLYQTNFNENEYYTIDFENQTFEYKRYSIAYSYSWKGDVGSMGACTYNFATGIKSSSCEDETIETLEEVKNDFEMELYFCDMTLDDLIREE